MFCTQCGTQIDPEDNFCKGCGARIGRAPDPSAVYAPSPTSTEPTAPARPAEVSNRRQQMMPFSPPRDAVDSNMRMIIAGAIVVIVLAVAGVYFGTDLLREPTPQKTSVAEALVPQTKGPPLASATEENKSSGEGSEQSQSSLFIPRPPKAASPPPLETPAPAPKPEQRRPQFKPAGRDAPPSSRANRPPPPVSASRAGVSPGIYQTLRATTLFESASPSSRVVANIPSGVRVNVVSTRGDWLEVRSRRGNPPGFIRRADAQFVDSVQ